MYRNILCICVPYLDTNANNHKKHQKHDKSIKKLSWTIFYRLNPGCALFLFWFCFENQRTKTALLHILFI